jgi:hypothetical protein
MSEINPLMPGGSPEVYRPLFLRIFRFCGIISEAALMAGVTPAQVRTAIRNDPSFAALVADAREDATDLLEIECRRRAISGSDLLMMFMLKKERPEYRDRVLPPSTTTVNVKAYVGFSPDEWDKPRDQLTVDSTAVLVDNDSPGTTELAPRASGESDLSLSTPALASSSSS